MIFELFFARGSRRRQSKSHLYLLKWSSLIFVNGKMDHYLRFIEGVINLTQRVSARDRSAFTSSWSLTSLESAVPDTILRDLITDIKDREMETTRSIVSADRFLQPHQGLIPCSIHWSIPYQPHLSTTGQYLFVLNTDYFLYQTFWMILSRNGVLRTSKWRTHSPEDLFLEHSSSSISWSGRAHFPRKASKWAKRMMFTYLRWDVGNETWNFAILSGSDEGKTWTARIGKLKGDDISAEWPAQAGSLRKISVWSRRWPDSYAAWAGGLCFVLHRRCLICQDSLQKEDTSRGTLNTWVYHFSRFYLCPTFFQQACIWRIWWPRSSPTASAWSRNRERLEEAETEAVLRCPMFRTVPKSVLRYPRIERIKALHTGLFLSACRIWCPTGLILEPEGCITERRSSGCRWQQKCQNQPSVSHLIVWGSASQRVTFLSFVCRFRWGRLMGIILRQSVTPISL